MALHAAPADPRGVNSVETPRDLLPLVAAGQSESVASVGVETQLPGCADCGGRPAAGGSGAAARCGNPSCPPKLRRRLEHFASKACVDIGGLRPALIEGLVAKGLVKNLPDLYRLRREDILALGKSASRFADGVLAAIEASRRAELWRFINGLGMPQVGAVASRELAREFGSLEALAAVTPADAAGRQMQRAAAGGGNAAVRVVTEFFADANNRALVADLLAAGVRPTAPAVPLKLALAGKTIALAGTFPTLTRAEVAAQIEAAGGKMTSTVSRNTHYVVAGADAGAKLEQARSLGVTVIDEAELRRLLDEK